MSGSTATVEKVDRDAAGWPRRPPLRRDIPGVINGLRLDAGDDRRPHSQGVDIANRVRHPIDSGGTVVPPHYDYVEVASAAAVVYVTVTVLCGDCGVA